jgi:two-component system, chemotaxis family, protein-glutamate methylesterase/glutaminase
MARGIRVLIVDDSAVVREALRRVLGKHEAISAVETAADGRAALRKLVRFHPDVVTLDVEMPDMDGLTVLRRMMTLAPRPVIMLSAFTSQGAHKTIRALELGAVDFIQKPSGPGAVGIQTIEDELLAKLVALGSKPRSPPRNMVLAARGHEQPLAASRRIKPAPVGPAASADTVVAIGASTGGTEAIRHIASHLPADLPAGVVVTQHMPAGFTKAFANRLNELAELEVVEAAHHDIVRPGRVLIAPGGYHLTVHRDKGVAYVELNRRPPVSGHRPSVDVLFASVAQAFGSQAIGILLTGMGRDGAEGLLAIRRMGGQTMAQDEASSVVYGMPRAAVEVEAAQAVVALDAVAGEILGAVALRQAWAAP